MDLFDVFRTVLVVVVSVSILVPLNIPLAALAYKVHLGTRPLPLEPAPFWWRSAGVALGLAAGGVLLMIIDYWMVTTLGLPPGFVHGTLLLVYLCAGVVYVFWMFALDELLEGASVFVIYLAMPGFLVALLVGFDVPLWPITLVQSFLKTAA